MCSGSCEPSPPPSSPSYEEALYTALNAAQRTALANYVYSKWGIPVVGTSSQQTQVVINSIPSAYIQEKLPTESSFITVLPTYTSNCSIKVAFSVRRLCTGYAGPILRLQRPADGMEMDFIDPIGNGKLVSCNDQRMTVIMWLGSMHTKKKRPPTHNSMAVFSLYDVGTSAPVTYHRGT